MDIKKIEEEIKNKKGGERKSYLKKVLKEEKDPRTKKEIKNLLVEAIKKDVVAEYYVAYDSMQEGLEPIYFWILDFMRDKQPGGLGLTVTKGPEEFEAASSSGFFGEMGSRATVMQQRAMEMLKNINVVIKSVLNLIYDLKEFEIRIATYNEAKSGDKDKKEGAELGIKTVWMDQVDMQKGIASMNQLAQKLGFVTIRDAFMQVNTENDVEKLDLNRRVKNILKRKVNEYLKWKDMSEKELRKRYSIERTYLKSQIDSLKLYTNWAKPYLRAAQKLKMKEFRMPDLVNAFSTMQMAISLIGKTEINPGEVHKRFAKSKFDKKYYAVLETDIMFRSSPQTFRTAQGQQYSQGGRADIHFRAYALDTEEMEILEEQELYEDMDLVENLTDVSLKELQEDLDHFLKEEKEEVKKKEKHKSENPLKGLGDGFKEMVEPFKFLKGGSQSEGYKVNEIKSYAKKKAEGLCWSMYEIYKKAHGMVTW